MPVKGYKAHKTLHQDGGTDELSVTGLSGLLADDQHVLDAEVVAAAQGIKLDDFATPDDNTDLNASATRHGLLPKLSNVATQYLDGTGAFSVPAGASKLAVVTVTVHHDDASPLAIVTIPANSVILGATYNTIEVWNGAGPNVAVGDAADTDGLTNLAGTDLTTTGYKDLFSTAGGAYIWDSTKGYHPKVVVASMAIIATITVSGATQGETIVTIWYMIA